jgi:hypothetical protein
MSTCSVPSPARPARLCRTCGALESLGFAVDITRRPEDSGGEFVQLAVSRGDETMLLDLARDWRQKPPTRLDIGPVLDIEDAVGSKVTALVGRGLPRDFIEHALDAVPAAAFAAYELNTAAITDLRERFAGWPRDESCDEAGRRAYDATRP